MPGPYGHTKTTDHDHLLPMRESLMHYPDYWSAPSLSDEQLAASGIHAPYRPADAVYRTAGDLHLWVEGEAYNLTDFEPTYKNAAAALPELLLAAYRNRQLSSLLRQLNADCCAVLYDTRQRKVLLMSDRYGWRQLYYYARDGRFAWCGEVQGLLALPFVDKAVDPEAVHCFLEIGHLLGNRTLHRHIALIPPASILTYDLNQHSLDQQYYWTWAAIPRLDIPFDEAVDRVHQLFLRALQRYFNPSEQIGLFLSGGLDSRYLLAGLHALFPDYAGTAVTYGRPGCDDERIARRAAALTNWRHRCLHFKPQDWFTARLPMIARTGGMYDLQHMHGSEFVMEMNAYMQVNMNGFMGDLVLGGSYLPESGKDEAGIHYGRFYHCTEHHSEYYRSAPTDALHIGNRVRRFTNLGSALFQLRIEQRKPFADIDLMDMLYGLPAAYRAGHRLYRRLLLRHCADFFRTIPWQTTGYPVGTRLTRARYWYRRLQRIPIKLGLQSGGYHFTNYRAWIQQPPVAQQIQDALHDPAAPLRAYLPADQLHIYSRRQLVSQRDAWLRRFTVNYYLQGLEKAA